MLVWLWWDYYSARMSQYFQPITFQTLIDGYTKTLDVLSSYDIWLYYQLQEFQFLCKR